MFGKTKWPHRHGKTVHALNYSSHRPPSECWMCWVQFSLRGHCLLAPTSTDSVMWSIMPEKKKAPSQKCYCITRKSLKCNRRFLLRVMCGSGCSVAAPPSTLRTSTAVVRRLNGNRLAPRLIQLEFFVRGFRTAPSNAPRPRQVLVPAGGMFNAGKQTNPLLFC